MPLSKSKKKGGSRKSCESLVSGYINRTNKVRKCLLNHCRHDYDMIAAAFIWKNPQVLEYIRESQLGEGKDMTTEKAQKNIKKKEELGFTGFRVYRFSYKQKTFIVKMAVIKDRYEQFYSLCEE